MPQTPPTPTQFVNNVSIHGWLFIRDAGEIEIYVAPSLEWLLLLYIYFDPA